MIRYIAAFVIAACLGGAAQAQIAGNAEREQAFLAQIEAARAAPFYKETRFNLDVARVMQAAGLPLTTWQKAVAGESAMSRGVSIEAEAWLQQLVDTGEFGGGKDPRSQRNRALFTQVQADAKYDREGGLAKDVQSAAMKRSGMMYIAIGENYAAQGDYETAAEMIAAGIAKGGLDDIDTGYARLNLGIAQYKGGRIDEARATWAAIDARGGSRELAQAWLMIARG